MADERLMERNLQPLAGSPCDVHFQVSLLRLVYPGTTAATQVAALEQLREPTKVVVARN